MPDSDSPGLLEGLQPFRNRSPLSHAVALLAVGAVGTATYLLLALWAGGVELLVSGEPQLVRTRTYVVSATGVVLGVALGVCYTRALGGLGLSFVALVVYVLAIPIGVGLAFGSLVDVTAAGRLETGFLRQVLLVGLPGILAFFGCVVAWHRWLESKDRAEAWVRRHVPPAFKPAAYADAATGDASGTEPPETDDPGVDDRLRGALGLAAVLFVGGYVATRWIRSVVVANPELIGGHSVFLVDSVLFVVWLVVWVVVPAAYALR